MHPRSVDPAKRPPNAVFRVVPSKSMTHRALVASALARGTSELVEPLDSDDTRRTLSGLTALGFRVGSESGLWTVEGLAGEVPGGGEIYLGESGTTCRFLTALAALGDRPSRLDGSSRLRDRPLVELVEALDRIGADIRPDGTSGGLPLRAGGVAPRGGAVAVRSERSSQFASALLLVAARLPEGLEVDMGPRPVSWPYVSMTLDVLRAFGIGVESLSLTRHRVAPSDYAAIRYRVEGDHSAAAYFLLAAAVCGGRVRMDGLDPRSSQADARFGEILQGAGVTIRCGDRWVEAEGGAPIQGLEVDLADAPDLLPTVAVLALFARGPSRISGLAHARLKESDRLDAVADGLRSVGRVVVAGADSLEVEASRAAARGAVIRTRSDHRIAMAFAVAGLGIPGIVIDDAGCVSKSYPRFWDDFARLGSAQNW